MEAHQIGKIEAQHYSYWSAVDQADTILSGNRESISCFMNILFPIPEIEDNSNVAAYCQKCLKHSFKFKNYVVFLSVKCNNGIYYFGN